MSNVILGSDGIAIRQGIYEEKSTQETDLGRFIDFEDGRRFRYCKASGAITKAHMCQCAAMDSDHTDVVQTGYGLSIGDKDDLSVLLTAAPTVNEYADGYLICNLGTGLGQMYKIKKNTAAYAPCKIWLYDKIITAIAAASEITLVKNRYLDVVVSLASATGTPIGVPLITITTGGYYFWAQTRGSCPLVTDAALTVGDKVEQGQNDTGSCQPVSGDTPPIFGTVVYPGNTEEYAVIDLHLE